MTKKLDPNPPWKVFTISKKIPENVTMFLEIFPKKFP
jgi:hypothetical protein